MRLLVSIVFLILVISSFGKTGNEYWNELQKVANKRYSGIAGDVSVEVTVLVQKCFLCNLRLD